MAPDLTRIAALPGFGNGYAARARVDDSYRRPPPRRDYVEAPPCHRLMEAELDLRARAFAVLDKVGTVLPERPTLVIACPHGKPWRIYPREPVVNAERVVLHWSNPDE